MLANEQSPLKSAADHCCEAATRKYGREAEYLRVPRALPRILWMNDILRGFARGAP